VQRRDLVTALLGLAGVGTAASLLSSCAADSGAPESRLGQAASALDGAVIAWVDTILGESPTSLGYPTPGASGPSGPRNGDLATSTVGGVLADAGADAGSRSGNVVVIAKGCITPGDGGGGVFFWDPTVTAIQDDGGTVIHVSGGGWRRVFDGPINVKWFGAVGNGNADDTIALQQALNAAHCAPSSGGAGPATGQSVFIPPGIYITDAHGSGGALTLTFSGGSAVHSIVGAGTSTAIVGKNVPAAHAILELLGSTNTAAVDCELRDLTLVADTTYVDGGFSSSTCDKASFALRVGDADNGFVAERVSFESANGVRLKIAFTTSYAQISTSFRNCTFIANVNGVWSGNAFYSIQPESGGARWDNVRFESCSFSGLASVWATEVAFDGCFFSTNAARGFQYGCGVEVLGGSATFRNCYFEDHYAAINVLPRQDGSSCGASAALSDVFNVTAADCYFSANANIPGEGPYIYYGIWLQSAWNGTSYYNIQEVNVVRCTFTDGQYTANTNTDGRCTSNTQGASIKSDPLSVRNLWVDAATNVSSAPQTALSTPITVLGPYQTSRTEKVRFRGVTTGSSTSYAVVEGMTTAAFYIPSRPCFVTRVTLVLDASPISANTIQVVLNKNGTSTSTFNYTAFTQPPSQPQSGAVSCSLVPSGLVPWPGVFNMVPGHGTYGDALSVGLNNATSANGVPSGTAFIVEVELGF
jgi:hypothetical protein